MNRDEVLKVARECGVSMSTAYSKWLHEFAAAMYAKGAEDMRERAKEICRKRISYFKTSQACYQVEIDIADLPTTTNTEGEQV